MAGKKQQYIFGGKTEDHSIVIGSHGDAVVVVDGTFELSGIIYCPKYIVTLAIEGTGSISFRGICRKVIVKKISGKCHLDLRDLTCKEFECHSARQQAKITTGKVRAIRKAILRDDAILQLLEKPLMSSTYITSGNSRILQPDQTLNVSA